MFSPALIPKWSKFFITCNLETCTVFFILSSVIQGGLFSFFFLLFKNQISHAGNYYCFILGLIVTLTFLQREKKKKSIQTYKTVFLFWRKTNFLFFHERDQKNKKHSKQVFYDSQLHALHSHGSYYPIIYGFSCIILSVYFTGVILFIFALIILELVQHTGCLSAWAHQLFSGSIL